MSGRSPASKNAILLSTIERAQIVDPVVAEMTGEGRGALRDLLALLVRELQDHGLVVVPGALQHGSPGRDGVLDLDAVPARIEHGVGEGNADESGRLGHELALVVHKVL